MKKYKALWACLLLTMGCEGIEPADSAPPEELIGAWVEVSEKRTAASKACAGFEVSDQGVSYGLLKIKEDGTVYSIRNIKNTEDLYHFEGTVDSEGSFYPTEEAKKEYLGLALQEAEKNKMQLVFKISLDKEEHSVKGSLIEMQIDAKLVSGGFEISYPIPNRYFSKTTDAAEKNLTSKLKTCLQGIP